MDAPAAVPKRAQKKASTPALEGAEEPSTEGMRNPINNKSLGAAGDKKGNASPPPSQPPQLDSSTEPELPRLTLRGARAGMKAFQDVLLERNLATSNDPGCNSSDAKSDRLPVSLHAMGDFGAEFLLLKVHEHPGCSTRDALRQAGVSKARFYRTLKVLIESGQLVSVGKPGGQFLFPAWPGVTDSMPQLLALQNMQRRRICFFLVRNGPLPRSMVLNHSKQTLNLSPRSTEAHLTILAQVGIVQAKAETQTDRRQVYLSTVELSLPVQILIQSLEPESFAPANPLVREKIQC